MPTNLELKASIDSPKEILLIAKRIGRSRGTLVQTDTYFSVPDGRLKLREVPNRLGELISYRRNEGKGERWSDYSVYRVRNAAALKKALCRVFQIDIIVRKRRKLFLYRGARIHIDHVLGLGDFIEFEVVVRKGRRGARAVYAELMKLFLIGRKKVIRSSYADLVREKRRKLKLV